MALIIDGLTTRRVKNLGWLLAHWRGVERFTVLAASDRELRQRMAAHDCYFIAHMQDGRTYVTTFASASILWQWLSRPVFVTVPVLWFGIPRFCGNRAPVERTVAER